MCLISFAALPAYGLLVTPSSSALASGGEDSSSTSARPVPPNLALLKRWVPQMVYC